MTRGKYIVIEGNDGTGKSTQVELLAKWLETDKGIKTFVMHEPAGVPIADAIRTVIKNGELKRDAETNLLLFTAARHEIWAHARTELQNGKWVLSARNYLSTLVYQGYAEGLDIELIRETTHRFTDKTYMNPDYTFILELAESDRKKRIAQRGELIHKDTFEDRDAQFQSKLDEGYRQIVDELSIESIDASSSIESIQEALRSKLF